MQLGKLSNGVKLLLYICSFVSFLATITLIAFFALSLPPAWEYASDFSEGVFALVMLPVVVKLRPIYRASKSKISKFTWAVGVISVPGLAVLFFHLNMEQFSLIGFDPLTSYFLTPIFFILFEAWLIMFGIVLKGNGVKHAIRMSLLAVTLVGYPIWAIWLARQVSV